MYFYLWMKNLGAIPAVLAAVGESFTCWGRLTGWTHPGLSDKGFVLSYPSFSLVIGEVFWSESDVLTALQRNHPRKCSVQIQTWDRIGNGWMVFSPSVLLVNVMELLLLLLRFSRGCTKEYKSFHEQFLPSITDLTLNNVSVSDQQEMSTSHQDSFTWSFRNLLS